MCDYPDCKKGNRLPFFSSCKEHQCKADRCHLTQIKSSDFCKNHIKKCAFLACSEKVDNTIYCKQHKCKEIGCQNFSLVDLCKFCTEKKNPFKKCLNKYCFDKTNQIYCDFHRCPEPDCQNKRSIKKTYCKNHRDNLCQNISCDNKVFNRKYCEEHACKTPGCQSPQDFYKPYCEKHIIGKWICKYLTCGLELKPGEKYCFRHKCNYINCPNEKSVLSGFCKIHTRQECKIPNCSAEAETGSNYCKTHQKKKCQYPHCSKFVDSNFSTRFCFNHISGSHYYDPFDFSFYSSSKNSSSSKPTPTPKIVCQAVRCDILIQGGKYCYIHNEAGSYLELKGIKSKEDLKIWFKKNHPDKSEKPVDSDIFTKIRQYGKEIYPSG